MSRGDARFDVAVVGAGPAGSIAALVLARGGARVALIDKASFPRDKACGDLIGPRGVRLLDEIGIQLKGTRRVVDMVVVGPTGRKVNLPCLPGPGYADHALALPRLQFDAALHDAAVAAGAEPFPARACAPLVGDGRLGGVVLSGGERLRSDLVMGADGATSRVAEWAQLVEPRRSLWGFALRGYLDSPVESPHIVLWEPVPRSAFPGYGWLFPTPGGGANVGLGVGTLADRSAGARAARCLTAFIEHLRRCGLVLEGPEPAVRLGGWLRMGLAGSRPAQGNVFLVGDAAGLVNPLQGEGIAPAMSSARAAAEAILADPARAAAAYRSFLDRTFAPYHPVTAAVHASLLGRPHLVSAVARTLTAAGVGRAVAGGWSVYWNDLLDGAAPGPARRLAWTASTLGRLATWRSVVRRSIHDTLRGDGPPAPDGDAAPGFPTRRSGASATPP